MNAVYMVVGAVVVWIVIIVAVMALICVLTHVYRGIKLIRWANRESAKNGYKLARRISYSPKNLYGAFQTSWDGGEFRHKNGSMLWL